MIMRSTGYETEEEHPHCCCRCGEIGVRSQFYKGYVYCGPVCVDNEKDEEYENAREQRAYEGLLA